MTQLLAHLVGDYLVQSDWMAMNKRQSSVACFLHCLFYTVCFVPITQSWQALCVIFASHFLMDRFGLARYVVYAKNALSPATLDSWEDCSVTGYHKDRPMWMTVWLTIAADNTIHLLCNYFAIKFL